MWRLILGLMLACAALSTEAADGIEKGAEDLLRNATLSQPFTVFDQLLFGLARKASEVAKQFRPKKNDFQPSRTVPDIVFSRVGYEASIARTGVEFDLTVSGIDDPWRDVCAKRVKEIARFSLQLPNTKYWELTARGFFLDLLGPRLTFDDAQLSNYKTFSDSIVVVLTFTVESGDRAKPLKLIGRCSWDNKTGRVSYQELKY